MRRAPRSSHSARPRSHGPSATSPSSHFAVSAWNFYQFLSSRRRSRRSSSLKFLGDLGNSFPLFLRCTLIAFLWDRPRRIFHPFLFFTLPSLLSVDCALSPLCLLFHQQSPSRHPPSLYFCLHLFSLLAPLDDLFFPLSFPLFSLYPLASSSSRIPARDNPYKLEH